MNIGKYSLEVVFFSPFFDNSRRMRKFDAGNANLF